MGDIYRTTIIKKSQKDHVCEHCSLVIPKGSTYTRTCGLFDGSSFDMKAHHECEKEYSELNSDSYYDDYFLVSDSEEIGRIRNEISSKYNLGQAFDFNGTEIKIGSRVQAYSINRPWWGMNKKEYVVGDFDVCAISRMNESTMFMPYLRGKGAWNYEALKVVRR